MSFREKDLARRFIVFIDAVYESKVGVLYPWISWVVHFWILDPDWTPTGVLWISVSFYTPDHAFLCVLRFGLD